MKVTLDIPQAELEKLVNPTIAEPRIPLGGIAWEQYENLVALLSPRPRLRLSYLEGMLEIMTISPEHEAIKSLIGRLIEIYALEKDVNLFSCGSATYRKQASERGLEPDKSYCIGTRKELPDLAIEVVITSGGINKLDIYRGLNVQEVWFWQNGAFTIHQLLNTAEGYEAVNQSQLLPDLDLNLLAQYVNPVEEPQMVKAFRQMIKTFQ